MSGMKVECTYCGEDCSNVCATFKGNPYHFGCLPEPRKVLRSTATSPREQKYGDLVLETRQREKLAAKAYVFDSVSGLVPSDAAFDDIWAVIPEGALADCPPTPIDFIDLAAKVRTIRHRYAEIAMDAREG